MILRAPGVTWWWRDGAMKDVLMLAPLPIGSAATRFRLHQYIPALLARGMRATIRPFLNEADVTLLYGGRISASMALAAWRAVWGRVRDMVAASRADVIVVQRELALVGPPVLEWLLRERLRRPVVFDFDDAIWEPYASPTYGATLSRLLKIPSKTHYTVRAANEVIAGSPYLAAYARARNPKVTVIPTVVDTEVFLPRRGQNATPVIGWIGTHSTGPYLAAVLPSLARLARHHDFVLRVIGARVEPVPGVKIEHRPWSLATEVQDFQALDVGLYPMPDDRWSRGKSGFKAIQYMACGVPVVASPVGPVKDIIAHGQTGFLATHEDEWTLALTRLLDDAELRAAVGAAGRANVKSAWSLQKFAPVFADVIERASW